MTKDEKIAQLAVENFNLKVPIGSKVRVWSMKKEGPGEEAVTLSEAKLYGSGRYSYGTVFVSREGKSSSSFSISHVELVTDG